MIFGISLCLHSLASAAESSPRQEGASILQSSNACGSTLYLPLSLKAEGNCVYSPLSIFSCLSMAYMGARGTTADEMQKVLKIEIPAAEVPKATKQMLSALRAKGPQDASYQVRLANALFTDKRFYILSDFRHLITSEFQGKVETFDFKQPAAAAAAINQWASIQTEGRIPTLLLPSDLSENTRLVLVNALFFKGQWEHPFSPKNTKKLPFYPTPEKGIDTEMMMQGAAFPYYENELLQVLALPILEDNQTESHLACLIALPRSGENLARLEQDFGATLYEWMDNLSAAPVSVTVPKFHIHTRYDLKETLLGLGMEFAFSNSANFAGIDGMRDLLLSKVIHESDFLFDENGITAAAATAAVMNLLASPTTPTVFCADHPFLFFLVDLKTHVVLFMGKCTQGL